MGYTANYLDVILVGGIVVVAIVYLFVKGELKKW
jgi:hypothetical protein